MLRLITTSACLVAASGCTLLPEAIQPHQLWKLNRQAPSGRDDAFFSVRELPAPTSSSYAKTVESSVADSLQSTDPFAPIED